LQEFAPAAVLVNRGRQILYCHGPVGRYLEQPPGEPTHDLLAMAREGLGDSLGAAVEQAAEGGKRVTVPGVRVGRDGESAAVRVTVRPVPALGAEALLLVTFEDEPGPAPPPGRGGPQGPGTAAPV
jgi:two-component system CheB/CheR fusion protein